MFLITNQTPSLGKLLKNHFKCEFLLVKYEIPYETLKSEFVAPIDAKMEGIDIQALA